MDWFHSFQFVSEILKRLFYNYHFVRYVSSFTMPWHKNVRHYLPSFVSDKTETKKAKERKEREEGKKKQESRVSLGLRSMRR